MLLCLALARAKLLLKAPPSSFHLPAASIASTALPSGSVGCSVVQDKFKDFLARASCKAAPVNLPPRHLGWPSLLNGGTSVRSTATWAPFQRGKPLAMTAMRRSSCRWGWLMWRSLPVVLVVTQVRSSNH